MSKASNETPQAKSMVAYRDRDNNNVYVYDERNADLEARPNFERVSLAEVPESALRALESARAEQRSIEASAAIHARRVEVSGEEAARAANAAATSTPGGAAVTPTGSHYLPESVNPPEGVLSRPGMDAVQIGPNTEEHPRTRDELAAQAASDTANAQPVLARPNDAAAADSAKPTSEASDTVKPAGDEPKSVEPKPAKTAGDEPKPAPRRSPSSKPAAADK